MIKNVETSVTTQTSSQLAALEPCVKAKVGCVEITEVRISDFPLYLLKMRIRKFF